jgi:hypothetical protein
VRKISSTIKTWPEGVTEGSSVHFLLEKSGVTIEVDGAFVARITDTDQSAKEFTVEATGNPTYGDKELELVSNVIVCWVPNNPGHPGSAQLWTSDQSS